MSKVAREIDEGPPCALRLLASKVAPIRVFTIVTRMAHAVRRVFASKYAVERKPEFDIRREFIDTSGWGYAFYASGFTAATRCCFVNYKLLSRIGGHTHTEEEHIPPPHRSFRIYTYLAGWIVEARVQLGADTL